MVAAALCVAMLAPAAAQTGERAAAPVEVVLARVHAYLDDYASRLPAMIATEEYEQLVGSGMRRNRRLLLSDYGLIQVPGDAGVARVSAAVLRFVETGRPTITRTRDQKDLPAQGAPGWIPKTGGSCGST